MAGSKSGQASGHLAQQLVALFTAIGHVVIGKAREADHGQHTGSRLFFRHDFRFQALIKGTAAGQPGYRVFTIHFAQMLDKPALTDKQTLQVVRHLVHGFGYAVQLTGGAGAHPVPEIPPAPGPGLLLQCRQRPQ